MIASATTPDDEDGKGFDDAQIVALFREFDTDASGFIDVGELRSALSKAGSPISIEKAQELLNEVDVNDDGVISEEEFRSVFRLAPNAVPDALRPLTGVGATLLKSLERVGEALGIESVAGQWRNTESGSRYVDDVIGVGDAVQPGDLVRIHYTVTLLTTGSVVETSRGGPPAGFQLGEGVAGVQSWDDAVAGMRVGGQRRVYAKPKEGDGPTARYDIEVIAMEDGAGASQDFQSSLLKAVGGRRAAFRLLFAASFIPYFIPEKYQPEFFKSDYGGAQGDQRGSNADTDSLTSSRVNREDMYAKQQIDALFAQEQLPTRKK